MHLIAILMFIVGFNHHTLVFAAKHLSSLPKEFTLCKSGDDVCLLSAITKALKILQNGMPKVGVLPLDPLRVAEMHLNQGTGPVRVNMVFRDMDYKGIQGLQLTSAKGDFGNATYRLEMHGKMPAISLIGDYTIKGQILVLPITGVGKENLTFTDVGVTYIITGHVIDRAGVEFVHIDDFKFKYTTQRAYVNFENLFNGDKRLGDAMNQFMNENWRVILQELQPVSEQALGEVFKQLAFRLYDRVPYRKIHAV